MSEVFTASNGSEVYEDFTGTIYRNGIRVLYAGDVTAAREFFVHQAETDWQVKRDAELGRWRWPENPDYVVYPERVDVVRVLKECVGGLAIINRDLVTVLPEPVGHIFYDAARAYFDAHPLPEPRPGEDAKEGDVWVLTVGAREPEPYTRSGSQFRNTTHWWYATNQAITAGYPLWVDGKAVNGQEAGA